VGRPAGIPRDTALAPLRPTGRLVRYCGIAFMVPHVLAFLAVAIGALAGLVPFLVTTMFFGVLLGWLRLASGLIWPGVIAHAANNTLITGFVNVVFVAGDQRAFAIR
jgi:membrane protease YdiL (CAAX protease family)